VTLTSVSRNSPSELVKTDARDFTPIFKALAEEIRASYA